MVTIIIQAKACYGKTKLAQDIHQMLKDKHDITIVTTNYKKDLVQILKNECKKTGDDVTLENDRFEV